MAYEMPQALSTQSNPKTERLWHKTKRKKNKIYILQHYFQLFSNSKPVVYQIPFRADSGECDFI